MSVDKYKQRAEELGVPVIPPIKPNPVPNDPNPTVAVCGECGLEIKRVMGYCCGKANCPTGMGPTIV